MSTTDHPAWFYQQRDITDPTPYEEDLVLPGTEECVCWLCGYELREGQTVMELFHCFLRHDRLLFHERCFEERWKPEERELILDALERFGFDYDCIAEA